MMRRRKVRKFVEEYYWDGFFSYLGDGWSARGMQFSELPKWCDDVADLAYKAGYEYAKESVAKVGTRKFGRSLDRTIPPRVWADAFGAARLPS